MKIRHAFWILVLLLAGCGFNRHTPGVPTPETTQEPPPSTAEAYQRIPWTAEQANKLIQELHQTDQAQMGSDGVLHQALLLAIQEAMWSFPQAPQFTSWRWLQASLQARDGVSRAAQTYGKLIQAGIQSEDVLIAGLSSWLEKMEPEGTYTATQPTAFPEGQAATLLEFTLQGQSAYYWISPHAEGFQVSLLAHGREFQSAPGRQTWLEWQDLTGDGQAEAWIITADRNRRIEMAALSLYDLSSGSAQRMTFSPELPALPTGSWEILEEGGRAAGLKVGLRVDGGSADCEYLLPVEYRLEGSVYRRTAIEQPDVNSLVAAGFSEAQARLCMDLSVDWLRDNANQDDLLALHILEALMPGFPYGADATLYVGLYPPDEIDRARFELGLNYARRGDVEGMEHWMVAILAQPAFEGSPWQAQAQAFLDAYQAGGDLRSACLASRGCLGSRRLNLNQLIGLMQEQDWADPVLFLSQNGVAVAQYGSQDFNQDGWLETWWLESTGGATGTLRILVGDHEKSWLNQVSLPAGTGTLEIQPLKPLLGLPVYQARRGLEDVIFLFIKQDAASAPEVWALEKYRTHRVFTLYQSVLQGGEISKILQSLHALQTSPYFNCAQPDEICQPLAQLAYVEALSLERAGDLPAAVRAYQQVWEDFPESSYAILARARSAP